MEIKGDHPGPRCGHTLTAVYQNETDPNTAKLILFGNAVSASWARRSFQAVLRRWKAVGRKQRQEAEEVRPLIPAATTRSAAGIRLAGATSEVHVFDVYTATWKKIVPLGEAPSPRAAHAGAAVGSMVVIQVQFEIVVQPRWIFTQGGIGPAGLASEDLHVLDFTDFSNPKWHRSDDAFHDSWM